jgi:hypothetical protein
VVQAVTNVKIIRQVETEVRVFPNVCRFTTIVGVMLNIGIEGNARRSETYTCQVGPVLQEHEFLGASCLPSIGWLEPATLESAQCVLESWVADWNKHSGQVEIRVQISGGGTAKLQVVFSVTILAAA